MRVSECVDRKHTRNPDTNNTHNNNQSTNNTNTQLQQHSQPRHQTRASTRAHLAPSALPPIRPGVSRSVCVERQRQSPPPSQPPAGRDRRVQTRSRAT